ncbi:unnamed protein product [Moneuplotes crassus]|uniref:Uncharacterized protein n=1 Tax=Euplotes crassus TaxID=5936 RepID=A0AAD1XM01_EUPCR|nr:unnamed protein product [Moneuplotes crassus]
MYSFKACLKSISEFISDIIVSTSFDISRPTIAFHGANSMMSMSLVGDLRRLTLTVLQISLAFNRNLILKELLQITFSTTLSFGTKGLVVFLVDLGIFGFSIPFFGAASCPCTLLFLSAATAEGVVRSKASLLEFLVKSLAIEVLDLSVIAEVTASNLFILLKILVWMILNPVFVIYETYCPLSSMNW